MHKSFREYLLAEYYIESILYDKKHYLNVGIPSAETISYLEGLLELVVSEVEKIQEQVNGLLKSLLPPNMQQVWLLDKFPIKPSIISTLSKRAQGFYEGEQIVLFSDIGKSYQDKAWNVIDLPISKYRQIVVHRWVSLYILNKLSPEVRLDKKTLVDFILKTSHIAPPFSKRLAKVDLSGDPIGGDTRAFAGTSDIKLSGADLSGANLDFADLSHANLTFANLYATSLFHANLFEADLSGANLDDADLSHANLIRTVLPQGWTE